MNDYREHTMRALIFSLLLAAAAVFAQHELAAEQPHVLARPQDAAFSLDSRHG